MLVDNTNARGKAFPSSLTSNAARLDDGVKHAVEGRLDGGAGANGAADRLPKPHIYVACILLEGKRRCMPVIVRSVVPRTGPDGGSKDERMGVSYCSHVTRWLVKSCPFAVTSSATSPGVREGDVHRIAFRRRCR